MCDTTGLIDIAFQCYSGYSHLQQGWGYSVHSGERWRHVWGSHPPDCSADHGTYSRQAVVTCMCLWRRMKCIDYWNGSHRDRQPHHSGGVLGLLRLHETLVMGFPCFVRCTILYCYISDESYFLTFVLFKHNKKGEHLFVNNKDTAQKNTNTRTENYLQ